MKLNRVEKALMNNPVRALVRRRYEAVLMERLGGHVREQHVLEIGCGRGVGTEIIFERFRAGEVDAFDLDADMVEQARLHLSNYSPDRLRLSSDPEGEENHAPLATDFVLNTERELR